ncbi:MAG TPA: diguanylate cyclase [Solirubrobacteraceae bacterium]
MPRLKLRVAPKFLLVVAVLLPALIGLTSIGIHGLDVLKAKVNFLYSDHLQVTDQTDQLARDIGRAAEVSLHEIITTEPGTAASLASEMAQIVEPRVAADLAAMIRLHAQDSQLQRSQVRALVTGWNQFLALQHSGKVGYSGPDLRVYETSANRVSALFSAMDQEAAAMINSGLAAAANARSDAIRTQQRSQELMLWGALGCLLAVLAAVFLMVRDVVPRVRKYSAFARRVADGDLTGRLDPRGGDELTALAVALNEMVEGREALRRSTARQQEFAVAMQLTESEEEAQELLRRHLERTVPESKVVVLSRNNSDDRLEAATALEHDPVLAERLIEAKPRSCLAVRFATSQEQGADLDPLVRCEVCGQRPEPSTCEPLIVSGRVIGSVLLSRARPVDRGDTQRIRESVAQASPVLGNLRNLALAELRAATDSLTGLPNKRAAQETLARLAAQASRSGNPMAAGLLDLDHFKQVNDLHGHPAGDELLAMIAATLRSSVRVSDFVARYGGEEFLILLPDTGVDSAAMLAEKILGAISELVVPDLDRPVTASIGIAVFPEDANDVTTLIRHADRALYAAKRSGRNRVETFAGALTVGAP